MAVRPRVDNPDSCSDTALHAGLPETHAALARHIGQLKLTPKETEKGPIYEVDGALDLLNENDVVPVVARDGYPLHSTLVSIPLIDICLDPKLDLHQRSYSF